MIEQTIAFFQPLKWRPQKSSTKMRSRSFRRFDVLLLTTDGPREEAAVRHGSLDLFHTTTNRGEALAKPLEIYARDEVVLVPTHTSLQMP